MSRNCPLNAKGNGSQQGKPPNSGGAKPSGTFFQYRSSPADGVDVPVNSFVVGGQGGSSDVSARSPYVFCCSSLCFPIHTGLATLPCHGLVDTDAQDGVIGFVALSEMDYLFGILL